MKSEGYLFRLRAVLALLILAAVILSQGCARYRYVIVEPAEQRLAVGDEGVVTSIRPLEYRFERRDSRLGMRVVNLSQEPLRLVSDKSYVVDPHGATHPLPGGTIAPNAFIALLLPPAPLVYRSSPRFSFGLGFGHYYGPFHGPYHHLGWGYDPWLYGPTDFYPLNPPHHWEWKTGEVRLRLVYEDGDTNIVHNFTIDRQRVK